MRAIFLVLGIALFLLAAGSVDSLLSRGEARANIESGERFPELEKWNAEAKSVAATGNYGLAAEMFSQGFQKAARAGWTRGELLFLTNLANCYNASHQFGRAIQIYLDAKDRAEQSNNREMAGILASNIAGLYLAQGAVSEADRYIQESREALSVGEGRRYLPTVLLLQARVSDSRGDPDGAILQLRQAVNAADRAGDEAALLQGLDMLPVRLLTTGRVAEAGQVAVEAHRHRAMNGAPIPDICYLNLGLVRKAQGDLDAAERFLNMAFEASGRTARRASLWSIYLERARILDAKGRTEEAYHDLEQALDSARQLRLGILPAYAVRASARAALDDLYRTFIDVANRLCLATGRIELATRAFQVNEQYRALALRETLEDAAEIRERLAPEYWAVLEDLDRTATEILREPSPANRRQWGRLQARLTELEVHAGLGLPRSASFTSAALRPFSAGDIQEAMAPTEVIFSFHLGGTESYLWAISSERFELYALPSGQIIAGLSTAFRQAVQSPSAGIDPSGSALYRTLFGQVSSSFLSKPDWILLADGPLFEAPLSALPVPVAGAGYQFLIENHSWRVLPSAVMLLDDPEAPWSGPLVAIGDPVYNTADPRWRTSQANRTWWPWWYPSSMGHGEASAGSLNRLAGSALETARCAKAYQGRQAPLLLTGEQASLRDLKAALAHQPYALHLATHVVPAPGDTGSGQIAFSLSPSASPELAGPATVASLKTNLGLVVMSGCSSGGGNVMPGEGLLGLTRAWLRAGAHQVAATHWPTMDNSGELLESFYRHLVSSNASLSPQHALRLAQLDMLHAGDWRSLPDQWASFFIVSRK